MFSSRRFHRDAPGHQDKKARHDLFLDPQLQHGEPSFVNSNNIGDFETDNPVFYSAFDLGAQAEQALRQALPLDETLFLAQNASLANETTVSPKDLHSSASPDSLNSRNNSSATTPPGSLSRSSSEQDLSSRNVESQQASHSGSYENTFMVMQFVSFVDGEMHVSPTPPTQGQQHAPVERNHKQASQIPWRNFEFVYEDPSAGSRPRPRQKRSREDIESQKISVGMLKEFGGACLWCYRSKKKCSTEKCCSHCKASGRLCVRHPKQLRLHDSAEPNGRPVSERSRLPSPEALEVLRELMRDAFDGNEESEVKIQFNQQPDPSHDNVWILGTPRPYHTPSDMTIRHAVHQFSGIVMQYIHCPQLIQLENIYGSSPLFREALEMTKLFLVVQSLTTCRVHVKPFCTTQAQAILFLITTSCCQYVGEMSEGFSNGLCDAFRQKNSRDAHINPEHKSLKPLLKPMWATAALYYQMVTGLLNLQSSSVVSHAIGPLRSHLRAVRDLLWCVLKNIPFQKPGSDKMSARQAIKRTMPRFEPKQHFNLGFSWVAIDEKEDGSSSPDSSRLGGFPDPGLNLEDLLQGRLESEFSKFTQASLDACSSSSSGYDLFDWPVATQPEQNTFNGSSGSFRFTFQPTENQ